MNERMKFNPADADQASATDASNLIQLRRSPRSEFAMKLRALARDVEAGAIDIATIHFVGIDRQLIRHDFGNPFGSSGREFKGAKP